MTLKNRLNRDEALIVGNLHRYLLTLLIILTGVLTLKATLSVTISPNFSINPNPATVGQTVTFTDMSVVNFQCSPDYITYNWNFGAGATPPTAMQTINSPANPTSNAGTSQMVVYSTPGLKTVTLTVDAEDDCEDASESITYTINVLVAPAAIPTVSEWGMMILILLLLTLGVLKLRQGSQAGSGQVKMD